MSIHEPDHPNLPFVVDSNGIPRYLGHHPQPRMMSMYSPMFAADDLIPESQWEEFEDPLPPGFKIKDQDGKGACFPAGTRIRMADDSERRIEDVQPFERVVTAEGNIGCVIRTMQRFESDAVYHIKFKPLSSPWETYSSLGFSALLTRLQCKSLPGLRATAEHPILTKRGYVRADELRSDDYVAHPRGNLEEGPSHHKIHWWPIESVIRKDFQGVVYNLEVGGDHSYVAEGVGVHNCNGHAAATSLELARYVEGLDYVELSAWFIYSILCNGIDMGSSIGSALQLIQDQGCCPDTEVPYATINPRKLSAQAHTDAARFKATIAGALTSPEAVMTAVQRRIPINASICVGARFNNVDSNGIAPEGWGWDNHAIAHWGGAKKVNGVWYVKFINSWTAQWGINGCAWRRLDTCRGGSFEAYGVLAVMFDPEAQNNPPIIKVA